MHRVYFDHLLDKAWRDVRQFTEPIFADPESFRVGFHEALCRLLSRGFVACGMLALQMQVESLLLAVDAVTVGERAVDLPLKLGVWPAHMRLSYFLNLHGLKHLRVICQIRLFQLYDLLKVFQILRIDAFKTAE